MSVKRYGAATTFGKALIETGDLDPIYIMLFHRSVQLCEADRFRWLCRWMLAYWCFYHAGVATKLAMSPHYFDDLMLAALNEDRSWKRGRERRHFRGRNAIVSVEHLATLGSPESAIVNLHRDNFSEFSAAIQAWPGFGPWIAFKAADMIERILHWPIAFSFDDALKMYREPRAGAKLVDPDQPVDAVARRLLEMIGPGTPAPPSYDRPINVQEIETVLCKFKGHHKGHYPVGHDILEIKAALKNRGTECDKLAAILEEHTKAPEAA